MPRFELKTLLYWLMSGRSGINVTMLVRCLRQAYLERILPVFVPIDSLFSTYIGSLLHEPWGKKADIEELRIAKDFSGGIEITGRVDVIDEDILWELKTTRGRLPKEPKHEHIQQVQCYYTILKDKHIEYKDHERKEVEGRTLKGLKLQYLSVLEANSKIFDVPVEDQANFLKDRTRLLLSSLVNKRIPEKPDNVELCDYCLYSSHCEKMSEIKEVETEFGQPKLSHGEHAQIISNRKVAARLIIKEKVVIIELLRPIKKEDPTIANFLIPRVLESIRRKHPTFEYDLLTEEGLIKSIEFSLMDEQTVNSIRSAVRWCLGKST